MRLLINKGLEMNEAYSISVAARTALGVGPYSEPAVGRTPQIGRQIVTVCL